MFDVDDFDEAYVGPHTWDVKRFAADGGDGELGLHLDNTDGPVLDLLEAARRSTRTGGLLAALSHLDGARRRLSTGEKAFALDDDERARVLEAFARYLGTSPRPSASTAASSTPSATWSRPRGSGSAAPG